MSGSSAWFSGEGAVPANAGNRLAMSNRPCYVRANREVGRMLRTLIVEDEQNSRDRLRRLLGRYQDEVEVVGEADSGPAAVEQIRNLRPDLVFMDVSLPGFDGFDVLAAAGLATKVIFTTASQEHAVRAFGAGAAHYLLKPVDPAQLQQAVARVLKSEPRPATDTPRSSVNRILCRDRDTTYVIRAEEVLFFKADQGYTLVRTDTKEYLTVDSLGTLEERIGADFVRIHRNAVVNLAHVGSLRHDDGDVVVVLRNGMELPVSRRHAPGLRDRLLFGAD
jgi:DNA-binding LytR/AlgR family response regulator